MSVKELEEHRTASFWSLVSLTAVLGFGFFTYCVGELLAAGATVAFLCTFAVLTALVLCVPFVARRACTFSEP